MHKENINVSILNKECTLFSHYLMDEEPNAYVLEKYHAAHAVTDLSPNHEADQFDVLLIRISTTHPFITKLVDTYTSVFFRNSLIRRKWVLLLSILESCAPTYSYFDVPDSSTRTILFRTLLQKLFLFITVLFLSIILLMPVHIVLKVLSKFKIMSRGLMAHE